MIRFKPLVLTATAALALGLSACGDDPVPQEPDGTTQATEAGAGEVVIQGFRFTPTTLEVPAGTTVVWRNSDEINHTATSGEPGAPDGTFDVDLPEAGSSGEHTFDAAGTYAYYCEVHESMTAEVVVTG